MDMLKQLATLDVAYKLISEIHSDLCNSTDRGDIIRDISHDACLTLLRLNTELFNHRKASVISECEIKDLIDSFFGSDSAYYGVDGFAIAAVLAQHLRQKQQHMLDLIKKELNEALEQNMDVCSARREKCGRDEFVIHVQGKISALQGILDFIEKLEV